ncbi:putative periplasmic lipoprotein [Hafnia paralvei]|uniref:hypothetical protein n=1 Tax=Hafnia paralvei TaxID=546367 RepID=UPI001F32DA08|nr:hypothetical protein [Hafnia paralvei]MCE9949233.1 hypothetical protein [Hafnia paralvei]
MKKEIICSLIVLLLIGCDQSPEDKEKSNSREAIKLCWKDYDKKSLTPDAKRFVASVCEKMESDFKGRYGVAP